MPGSIQGIHQYSRNRESVYRGGSREFFPPGSRLPLQEGNIEGDKGAILDGKFIFKLMDSKGLPLDIINEVLRTHNSGFDVIQFIEAALESKNFTYPKIRARLSGSINPDNRDAFLGELDKVAIKKQWTGGL